MNFLENEIELKSIFPESTKLVLSILGLIGIVIYNLHLRKSNE